MSGKIYRYNERGNSHESWTENSVNNSFPRRSDRTMDRASKKKKEKRKKKKYHLSNRVYHHHQISFILSFSLFFLHPNTRLHHTLHHRPIRGSGIERENVTKMNVCTQHQGLLTSVSPFLLLSFTADLVAHLFITWALIYIYIRVYTSHRSPLVHD